MSRGYSFQELWIHFLKELKIKVGTRKYQLSFLFSSSLTPHLIFKKIPLTLPLTYFENVPISDHTHLYQLAPCHQHFYLSCLLIGLSVVPLPSILCILSQCKNYTVEAKDIPCLSKAFNGFPTNHGNSQSPYCCAWGPNDLIPFLNYTP